jgi:two-component system phosphate regulon sensor histidine kinase PhoR
MRPVVFTALVAPSVVAVATIVVGVAFGIEAAFVTLVAGAIAVVAYHLWQLDKLARWALGPSDAPVPEARGTWRAVFSALYRRMRSRAAVERELGQRLERFARAAEAIPEGVVVLDATHRIRWANARARAHLGLDAKRDLGQPVGNIVRQPELVGYLDAGDFSEPIVVESQREQNVTLSILIVPFGDEQKLLLSRDVTRIEAVARMRKEFIANVSHELKTPLTVVAGFLETLSDLDPDPRQRERFIGLMHEQAKNMQRLVDDLLTLSALESEQNPLSETAVPVAPLLGELAAQARELSVGRHSIVVDVAPSDETAAIVGARDELASAFGNLVSNAVRYTPDGGTVTLRWRIDVDGSGHFSVADTGIGISAEHVPRLTERFYRVDRSRSRATGGTGLGLAIVKHVAVRHQAQLEIESEPGRGSTFTVHLPAARVRREADLLAATGAETVAG